MNDDRRQRGFSAEQFVANRLNISGYEILARNWLIRDGEIDIVALDDEILVFVEVRSRSGDKFGSAEESVTPAKLNRIVAAGLAYIEANDQHADRYWRVDLIAVTLNPHGAIARYNHYENLVLD